MFSVYVVSDHDKTRKNRKLPCKFCGLLLFKLKRHITRKHDDIIEVAAVLAKPEKEKNLEMSKFVNQGIFNHNAAVLKNKQGDFIVRRPSSKTRVPEDYIPCKFCLQFFV